MSRVEDIGEATLYLGDARDVLKRIEPVDALICDPPYGINLGVGDRRGGTHGLAKEAYDGYSDSLENFQQIVAPTIKAALGLADRGAVFCTLNLHELPKPDAIGGVYIPAATGRHCWGYASLQPVGFYGVAPDLEKGPRPSVIRSNEIVEANGHPCPKPIGWMRWLVLHCSRFGECVLDPFMGSGTTGVACAQLGRKFIGIEIEPRYFDIACKRIEGAYKQGDLIRDVYHKPVQEALSLSPQPERVSPCQRPNTEAVLRQHNEPPGRLL